MGAERFTVVVEGETAEETFKEALEAAQWEHGHSGYSGSLADKSSFVMYTPDQGEPHEAEEYAEYEDVLIRTLLSHPDPNIRALEAFCDGSGASAWQDKWGPAGCVQLGPNRWCFFGLSPS
jgi:hypothetical protein